MTSINPTCPHCLLRQEPSHQTRCSKRDDDFTRRRDGQCISCGADDPDGPIDSDGDLWCRACADAGQ